MGITSNKSSEQVSGEAKLYTGLHNFKVIGLNPSKKIMEERLGMRPKSEPVYLDKSKNDENVDRMRLDFYLQSKKPDIRTKVAFWLENTSRISQAGDKVQVTNNQGQFTWVALEEDGSWEAPEYEWFSKEGLRQAYVGEEALVNQFIRNWANVENGANCYLEDIGAIAKGDTKELKNYVKALRDNEVRCLLGIVVNKGNTYQTIYPKMFDRPYNTRFTKWVKQLENAYGQFTDADYQNSFELQEYLGKPTTSQDTPDDIEDSDDDGEEPSF